MVPFCCLGKHLKLASNWSQNMSSEAPVGPWQPQAVCAFTAAAQSSNSETQLVRRRVLLGGFENEDEQGVSVTAATQKGSIAFIIHLISWYFWKLREMLTILLDLAVYQYIRLKRSSEIWTRLSEGAFQNCHQLALTVHCWKKHPLEVSWSLAQYGPIWHHMASIQGILYPKTSCSSRIYGGSINANYDLFRWHSTPRCRHLDPHLRGVEVAEQQSPSSTRWSDARHARVGQRMRRVAGIAWG